HVVSGRFAWSALPERLPVPADTGLLALSLRGRAVDFPYRDQAGNLWLQKPPGQEEAAEDRLEVFVERRLADEVPLWLQTRVDLNVSGKAREVVLGPALPEGFVPLALTSPVPAR